MTVLDRVKKAESVTIQALLKGDVFLYKGSVCMKIYTNDSGFAAVRLNDGEICNWSPSSETIHQMVEKLDYVALPRSEVVA